MPIVIDINHEGGDTSEWDSIVDPDGDELNITQAAALAGSNYGMAITIDDGDAIYARKSLSPPSAHLRVRKYWNPNSVYQPAWTLMEHFRVTSTVPAWGVLGRLYNRIDGSGNYSIRLTVYEDDNTQHSTSSHAITDDEHYIEFRISKASSNVAGDGSAQLWIDGVNKETISNLDNYDAFEAIQYIYDGVLWPNASTLGTVYSDEIVVRDDNVEIGPVDTGTQLSIQEMNCASSIDNVVLNQNYLLSIDDMDVSIALDNVVFGGKHVLEIQSIDVATSIDNVPLGIKAVLNIANMQVESNIDNVTFGDVFFVSKNGDNSDGQTWATAWNELNQIAWGSITPGATIYVDGGSSSMTYSTTLAPGASGTSGNPITIALSDESGRNGKAIFHGGRTEQLPEWHQAGAFNNEGGLLTYGISIINRSYITIDGGKKYGIYVHGQEKAGIFYRNSNNLTFKNIEVYNVGVVTGGPGTWQANNFGIWSWDDVQTCDQIRFESCYSHDCGQDTMQIGHRFTNLTVIDCIMENTRYHSIETNEPWNYGSHSDGIQVYGYGRCGPMLIQDSIFRLHTSSLLLGGTGGCVIDDVTIYNVLIEESTHNAIAEHGTTSITPSGWVLYQVTSIGGPVIRWNNLYYSQGDIDIQRCYFEDGNLWLPQGVGVDTDNCRWNTSGYALGSEQQNPCYGYEYTESLVIQALDVSTTFDNLDLLQHSLLAIDELNCTVSIDNLDLVHGQTLETQDITVASEIDNLDLIQGYTLAIDDMDSASEIDNLKLTVGVLLTIADMLINSEIDNLDLIHHYQLVIQAMDVASEIENLTLQTNSILIIADMLSSIAIDNVELSQDHTLIIQDATITPVFDNLELTQKQQLIIDDILVSPTIDNIGLFQSQILIIEELLVMVYSDSVILSDAILGIDDMSVWIGINPLALEQRGTDMKTFNVWTGKNVQLGIPGDADVEHKMKRG